MVEWVNITEAKFSRSRCDVKPTLENYDFAARPASGMDTGADTR